MLEFKPGQNISTGQRITMQSFSKLPGCTAILIQDDFWDDSTITHIPDEHEMVISVWKNGIQEDWTCTVARLNVGIAEWFSGIGMLTYATPDIQAA